MKYIANVVLPNGGKINYDKYIKRCTTLDEADKSIPTLIVGYEYAKRYIDKFNILKKWYPEQKLYWTFGKKERKYEYDDDIEVFYNMLIQDMCENISYKYINPLFAKYSEIKSVITLINSNQTKVIYNQGNKFLFLYDYKKHKVLGISLDMCEFIGVKREKIIDRFKKIINGVTCNNISFLNRKLREMVYKKQHLVPVFYYNFKL